MLVIVGRGPPGPKVGEVSTGVRRSRLSTWRRSSRRSPARSPATRNSQSFAFSSAGDPRRRGALKKTGEERSSLRHRQYGERRMPSEGRSSDDPRIRGRHAERVGRYSALLTTGSPAGRRPQGMLVPGHLRLLRPAATSGGGHHVLVAGSRAAASRGSRCHAGPRHEPAALSSVE